MSSIGTASPCSSGPRLSVVICTLDESDAIAGVLDELSATMAGIDHEIVVVDDSHDELTAQAVLACAAHTPQIRLLRRREGRGLASAAIAGWDAAHGQYLAIMDGDGQHDPRLIAQMFRLLEQGRQDVVVASRYLHSRSSGLGLVRHAMSRGAVRLTQLLLGARLADPMSGCFAMTRDWYADVRPHLSGLGFKILVDVVASGRRRPNTAEVPTQLGERRGGVSKMDPRVVADLLTLLLEKRTRGLLPAQMALFFAVGLGGLAVHLTALWALLHAGCPFWVGQLVAIMAAMTCNFLMNNILTFRHCRLRGARMLSGLLMFYLACMFGAFVNESIGWALHAAGVNWALAAGAGSVAAALWNYHAAKRTAWSSTLNPPQAAAVAVELRVSSR